MVGTEVTGPIRLDRPPDLPAEIASALEDDPVIRAASTTVVRMMAVLDDPRSTASTLEDTIRADVGLTARLLRLANSPMYCRSSGGCTSVRQAITLLGFSAVRHLALSTIAMGSFDRTSAYGATLWRHSVAVAALAKRLMIHADRPANAETAFIAGLLHDLGKFVLAQAFPQRWNRVFREAMKRGWNFHDTEREAFGCDHTDVGATVAMAWGFDNRLVHPIRLHHRLDRLEELDIEPITRQIVVCVRAADDVFRVQLDPAGRIAQEPTEAPPESVTRLLDEPAEYAAFWEQFCEDYRALVPILQ